MKKYEVIKGRWSLASGINYIFEDEEGNPICKRHFFTYADEDGEYFCLTLIFGEYNKIRYTGPVSALDFLEERLLRDKKTFQKPRDEEMLIADTHGIRKYHSFYYYDTRDFIAITFGDFLESIFIKLAGQDNARYFVILLFLIDPTQPREELKIHLYLKSKNPEKLTDLFFEFDTKTRFSEILENALIITEP